MKTTLSIFFVLIFTCLTFGQDKTDNLKPLSPRLIKSNSNASITAVSEVVTKLFIVDSTEDTNDSGFADGVCADAAGKCTLRAALDEAHFVAGDYIVTFNLPSLPAIIDLKLGQLLIDRNVTIVGPGARKLTVRRSSSDGTEDFRIFFFGLEGAGSITASLRGLTVAGGKELVGGGIYNRPGSTLTLNGVAVTGNTAFGAGGIVNFGTLNIERSLINGNYAILAPGPNQLPADGGGINNNAGVLTISNSTVTENSAVSGGGIYNFSGTVNLVNVTVSQNSATADGSNVFAASGASVNLRNTIIDKSNSSTVTSVFGAFNSLGNNLISTNTGSTGFTNGVNADQVGSDQNIIDPFLGALVDNGGQTDTRALSSSSPAIDHGNSCVLTSSCATGNLPFRFISDQRGYRRIAVGNVDIGAFEANAFPPFGSTSLGGVIFATDGRNVSGALVRLISPTGIIRYAFGNPFGQFNFYDVPAGEDFILEVRHKRFNFSPFVISPGG